VFTLYRTFEGALYQAMKASRRMGSRDAVQREERRS
jgi:hypothetical protein